MRRPESLRIYENERKKKEEIDAAPLVKSDPGGGPTTPRSDVKKNNEPCFDVDDSQRPRYQRIERVKIAVAENVVLYDPVHLNASFAAFLM